ncbi:hypothetical protein V3C99_006625 [Haemonchus contortus]
MRLYALFLIVIVSSLKQQYQGLSKHGSGRNRALHRTRNSSHKTPSHRQTLSPFLSEPLERSRHPTFEDIVRERLAAARKAKHLQKRKDDTILARKARLSQKKKDDATSTQKAKQSKKNKDDVTSTREAKQSQKKKDDATSDTSSIQPSTDAEEIEDPSRSEYKAGDSRIFALRKQQSEEGSDSDKTLMITAIIGGSVSFIALVVVIFLIIIVVSIARKKARKKAKETTIAKQPRKMESEDLNRVKFLSAGPLVLDRRLEGPVSDGISTDSMDMANNEVRRQPPTMRRTQKTIRKTKTSKRPHASQIKITSTDIKSPNPSNPSTSNRSHDKMAT